MFIIYDFSTLVLSVVLLWFDKNAFPSIFCQCFLLKFCPNGNVHTEIQIINQTPSWYVRDLDMNCLHLSV